MIGAESVDDRYVRNPFTREPDFRALGLDLLVPVLFSAHVGEHVERNVSLATSADARLRRPVSLTALRHTDGFALEPGPASWKHVPTPERCPAKNHLGEKGQPRLLCVTK